jgi:hypothetical protein
LNIPHGERSCGNVFDDERATVDDDPGTLDAAEDGSGVATLGTAGVAACVVSAGVCAKAEASPEEINVTASRTTSDRCDAAFMNPQGFLLMRIVILPS